MINDYVEYYKQNPDVFIETYWNVELKTWQKIMLRIILNNVKEKF